MAQQHKFLISTIRMSLGLAVLLVISDQIKVIHAELDCTSVRCPPAPDCPNDSYLKDIDTSFDPFINIHYERVFDPITPHDTDTTPSRHKSATQQHYDVEADEKMGRFKRETAEMPVEYADGNVDDEEDEEDSDDIERCCQQYECTCNECHMVECPRNHVAIELSSGKGTPGECCSTYKCVPDWECKADAEQRANISAKQIYWRNECTKCKCIGGKEMCTLECQQQQEDTNCYSKNLRRPMEDGSRWMEDACTSCWCNRGEPRCQISFCAAPQCKSPIHIPDRCCPVCIETAETTAKTTERPHSTTSTETTESESSSTTAMVSSTSTGSTTESTVEPEKSTTWSTTNNETESSDDIETTTDETVTEISVEASDNDSTADDFTDEPISSSTEHSTPSTEQTSDSSTTTESTTVTISTTEGASSSQFTEITASSTISTETPPTLSSDAPFLGSSSSTATAEWLATYTESPDSSSSTIQTESSASFSPETNQLSTSAPIAEVQATLLTAAKEQSDLARDGTFILLVIACVVICAVAFVFGFRLLKFTWKQCKQQNPLKNCANAEPTYTYTPVSGSEVSSQSSACRIQCMVDVE